MAIYLRIFYESIRMALQHFRSNKLRTMLSIIGITIGIFCIIAVKSAVDSLSDSIKELFSGMGSDVLIVDVFPWGEDPNQNYWKYLKRPNPSYEDYEYLKEKLENASDLAYSALVFGKTLKYKSSSVTGGFVMGTTFEYPNVQDVQIGEGRYFTAAEYEKGDNKIIIGNELAEGLFQNEYPIGKYVKLSGQKFQVIGMIKEEGDNPFGFSNYDNAVWMSFNTIKKMVNVKNNSRFSSIGNFLYIKAKEGVPLSQLHDEVQGKLRLARRLTPREDDNFALNEVSLLNSLVDQFFGVVNLAGFIIGLFALLVGMISVANIMFVSVKERTNIIGIKKAVGAK
ncbi:MAG: ABC transporter permease, partial [Melioribacteraceae bacterium]|nr:ABC transporter permease [Melioribacteraceae bacterium]